MANSSPTEKGPRPQLRVTYRAPDTLRAFKRNARTHSEAQIAQIAASIEEFGFTNPILVDEDLGIIAGHGRQLAALKLGLAEVPTIALVGLTDEQRRALVIADNQLSLNAGWDEALLRSELGELKALGFDLPILGFSDVDLARILDTGTGLRDPEAVPPVEPLLISQPGDVWLLGRHRLACGDACAPASVQALLRADKPHLMVTDPPYGVSYDANWRNEAARHSAGMGNRAIGAGAVGKVTNDDRADWSEAWALFPGDVAYVWHGALHAGEVQRSLERVGLLIRAQIIWAKSNVVIGRGHYHWRHEPCFYAVRKGKTGHWTGGRKNDTVWRIDGVTPAEEKAYLLAVAENGLETTVWEIEKPAKSETGHSTQKPVACMRRPIDNNSKHGDLVYEPFSGSGTTIIAAEQSGRRCLALEISPAYVDVAVRRWQTFTGKVAVLERTGEFFPQVEARIGKEPEVVVPAAGAAPRRRKAG